MTVSIRLTEEERTLANRYALLHRTPIEEAFKQALFEKLEDEYDAAVAEVAYQEFLDSGCKASPIQELWDELGL